jgi:preprotein translocase subunit SecG
MTLVSNDPSWWPLINANLIFSYFVVAGSVGIIYNWGLTFGKEIELIWRQRWSLMTFLYLSVRYAGIGFAVIIILLSVPTISMTDAGCLNMYNAYDWISVVIEPLLGVIMIARLHAMYQRSRKVLIFLVVIFLAITITNAVIAAIRVTQMTGEEFVFSGTYQCIIDFAEDSPFLNSMTWILGTVWEVLALCLAVWISVKHFRELRQHSTSGIIGDCFTVLMKTHLSYFASFLAISCFQMGLFSPTLANPYSLETQTYDGLSQIFKSVQMFVLGPRLILGVREYHAKLVANSDTASAMTSIAFEERVHVSTSSSV